MTDADLDASATRVHRYGITIIDTIAAAVGEIIETAKRRELPQAVGALVAILVACKSIADAVQGSLDRLPIEPELIKALERRWRGVVDHSFRGRFN